MASEHEKNLHIQGQDDSLISQHLKSSTASPLHWIQYIVHFVSSENKICSHSYLPLLQSFIPLFIILPFFVLNDIAPQLDMGLSIYLGPKKYLIQGEKSTCTSVNIVGVWVSHTERDLVNKLHLLSTSPPPNRFPQQI